VLGYEDRMIPHGRLFPVIGRGGGREPLLYEIRRMFEHNPQPLITKIIEFLTVQAKAPPERRFIQRGKEFVQIALHELLIITTVYVRWTTEGKDSASADIASTLFPQKLWKSLWKSRSVKLQVPENFILLAFCTRSRQSFQSTLEGRFVLMKRRLLIGRAPLFSPFLVCLLLVACPSCVKLSRNALPRSGQIAPPISQNEMEGAPLININTASIEELERLPGIGRGLASRILAHRNQYGRFRRAEHVMMVRGISERRFRAMRTLITAE
jgi:competence ComEA-like helix-hairpin-helix protein